MDNKEESPFQRLRRIDVSEHIEKKNGLSYLSWAWAIDKLLQEDYNAEWTYEPNTVCADETVLINCAVTAFGKTRKMQLPVMDYKNAPIKNPNAFQLNTAMQRCLVKTIALHGIGLYIYAGEDVPSEDKAPEIQITDEIKDLQFDLVNGINECVKVDELEQFWAENKETAKSDLPEEFFITVQSQYENRIAYIRDGEARGGVTKGAYDFRNAKQADNFLQIAETAFNRCDTIEELDQWKAENVTRIAALKRHGKRIETIKTMYEMAKAKLENQPKNMMVAG